RMATMGWQFLGRVRPRTGAPDAHVSSRVLVFPTLRSRFMNKPTANGTPVYTRQHSRTPTLPQLSAIDLLAAAKTDQEAADLLQPPRPPVPRWRLYAPLFRGALNRRRAEVWGAVADRLRSLIPKALDALAAALEDSAHPGRLKAAAELLRLAP